MAIRRYSMALPWLALIVPRVLGAVDAPSENPPVLEPTEDGSLSEDSGRLDLHATPSAEWELHKTADGTHPNGNEQAMVWLMNRARSNPADEGIYLSTSGDADVENAISYFGVDLAVLQAEFVLLEAKQPAAFDRRIYEGSLVHSQDLIARDAQDHNNQFDRIEDAGFAMNGASASVYSYARSSVHAHAGFNIDWGNDGGAGDGMQPGRGHRSGLMNSGGYALPNVGIAMVEENDSGTSVGPLVTSIVYAQANTFVADHYNTFLVGTVWDDLDADGIYDSGEGLSGVTVMPSKGTYYAITGESGGYAIPVSEDGEYTIVFSGGELSVSDQRVATVAGESVLVIWNAADSYNGLSVAAPNLAVEKVGETLMVSWSASDSVSFVLEVAGDDFVWIEDEREISNVDGIASFQMQLAELGANRYFRLKVVSAGQGDL